MATQSKHFSYIELKCPCCGLCEMNEWALAKFDEAREISGILWDVNSGYRCPKHDLEVKGNDNHPQGMALDIIAVDSHSRWLIIDALIKVKCTRFGIAKTFIHGDFVDNHPQEVIWFY